MGHTRSEMNEQDKPEVADDALSETTAPEFVADHGRSAIDIIRAGVASAREPIVGRVGQARDGVVGTWNERPGARVRRVRRMAGQPVEFLYDVHPEARSARPVEVGTADDRCRSHRRHGRGRWRSARR